MPKYDYACFQCDTQFEYELSINHNKPFCDNCGYVMIQVYSAPGIVFKGSGFYKTDK